MNPCWDPLRVHSGYDNPFHFSWIPCILDSFWSSNYREDWSRESHNVTLHFLLLLQAAYIFIKAGLQHGKWRKIQARYSRIDMRSHDKCGIQLNFMMNRLNFLYH